jgi:hypothetical protein
MSWRVWLFRSIFCTLCAAAGTVGWLVYLQTNSAAVRAKVIEQIQSDFPGVDVHVGSAWVRPLGGLWLRDVKLFRREDPSHPFLIIPSATVYHDKEQMAQGRLVIRKVELVQPTIRLRRDAEGNWNLPSLPKGGKGDGPVPMLVVRQGTVVYEDRTGGQVRPALEVRDVQLTVINDPLPRINFQGQGSTLLGALRWSGNYQRGPNTLTINFDVPSYTLTRSVMEQIGGHVPEIKQHLAGLEGEGDGKLELRYAPGNKGGWQSDLRVNLRRGRFAHARLPLSPLEDIELTARYRDGIVTVDNGRARSGPTRVTLELEAAVPLDGPRSEDPKQWVNHFNLAIEHLTLSRELFEQLPPNMQQIHKDFKPNGPIGLTFKLERRERWSSWRCIVQPEGISAEFVDFPYGLTGIHGKLEQVTTSDGKDELQVGLTGNANGRIITIEGISAGAGDQSRLDLTIRGNGIILDGNLRRALGRHRGVVEEFHPQGSGNFVARIRRNPGDASTDFHVQVEFPKLAVCHDRFPYPLENLSGTVRLRFGPETKITFEQFRGDHNSGEVSLDGTYLSTPIGDELRIKVRAAALPFDAELETAFTRVKLKQLLREMRPSGRLGVTADLVYTEWSAPPNARRPASRLQILCHHFSVDSMLPDFLPYEWQNVNGAFHFADDRVTMSSFKAQHRNSQLTMGAAEKPCLFIIKPEGGLWVRLQNLQLAPLVPDEELLCALPPQLRAACASLEPSGPMSLTADEFVIDTTADPPARGSAFTRTAAPANARMTSAALRDEGPSPWMYWRAANIRMSGASVKLGLQGENVYGIVSTRGEYRNGHLGAVEGNVMVDQAMVHKQPVQDLYAHLLIDPAKAPGVLQIKNIRGKLFGGNLGGEVALRLEPVLRYDVSLNAVGVKLDDVARHNKLGPDAELSGRAEAHLYLAGQGADLNSLRGGGFVRVPNGRIYNLPPLLDLLKFVKGSKPDGTFFEEAFAKFKIEGPTVHFDELDLVGNLVSLTGEGEMKLDGTGVRLDIYPILSRFVQALPGPVREVPTAIGRNLYKIEMTGSLGGKLNLRSEAVPVLVEPVRRLLGRTGQ